MFVKVSLGEKKSRLDIFSVAFTHRALCGSILVYPPRIVCLFEFIGPSAGVGFVAQLEKGFVTDGKVGRELVSCSLIFPPTCPNQGMYIVVQEVHIFVSFLCF